MSKKKPKAVGTLSLCETTRVIERILTSLLIGCKDHMKCCAVRHVFLPELGGNISQEKHVWVSKLMGVEEELRSGYERRAEETLVPERY